MEFQLLRCSIALGGDIEQVVVRHRGVPIVFPELILLQHIHGEDAITDIHVVGTWDTSQQAVRERLRAVYGDVYFNAVFPGAASRLPTADGSLPFCTLPIHVPAPARPEPPEPVLKPLDQFTMPASMPRVVSTYKEEPVLDDVDIDTFAAHTEDETAEALGLGANLADAITQVAANPKPDMPDPAAFRNRDNSGGLGTAAPRTADHLPDVATGPVKPKTKINEGVEARDRAPAGGPVRG